MQTRPRRLRFDKNIRELSRETRLSEKSLIAPLFIKEGQNIKTPIISLENHFHYSIDMVYEEVEMCLENGVNKFLLFGLPNIKDELGSQAYYENGVIQNAIRKLKDKYKSEIFLISDVCMCEYTSHGHCGVLSEKKIDNDKSVQFISKIALSHAREGVDMVAPSDMMDGRIRAIRESLDKNNFLDTSIMSYAVKYASAFYGPFRDAVGSAPSFGDRKSYQMDYHNKKEALKEAKLDIEEGADMLIVKPALSYLDIISEVSKISSIPVVGYSVSGEYAMIKSAAKIGLIDEYSVMCESAVSIFRSCANILITYYAKEIALAIKKGDIG